jgi:hypothetical protein
MRRILLAHVAIAAAAIISAPAFAQTCPIEGDAKQQLARELNPYKNRTDAPPAAKINSRATLNAVLAPGNDLNRWSREDAAAFEGTVINVKVGGIESVNCHAKDPAHRDTHIELALDSSARETQRVIVEVTPRWREMMAGTADWSTQALKTQLLGHRVRITGWLFDDLEHKAEAENTNPGGAKNWRATVWEIHPVTAIEVLSGAAVAASAAAPAPHVVRHHRPKSKRKCTRIRGHVCRRTSHRRNSNG